MKLPAISARSSPSRHIFTTPVDVSYIHSRKYSVLVSIPGPVSKTGESEPVLHCTPKACFPDVKAMYAWSPPPASVGPHCASAPQRKILPFVENEAPVVILAATYTYLFAESNV